MLNGSPCFRFSSVRPIWTVHTSYLIVKWYPTERLQLYSNCRLNLHWQTSAMKWIHTVARYTIHDHYLPSVEERHLSESDCRFIDPVASARAPTITFHPRSITQAMETTLPLTNRTPLDCDFRDRSRERCAIGLRHNEIMNTYSHVNLPKPTFLSLPIIAQIRSRNAALRYR